MTWKPAIDVNRIVTMALAVGGVSLVTLMILRGRHRRETHLHLWDGQDRARLAKAASKAARGSVAGLAPVAAVRSSRLFDRMPDLAERGINLLEHLPDHWPEAAERAQRMSPKVEAAMARAAERAVEAAQEAATRASAMADRLPDAGDRLSDLADRLPDLAEHVPESAMHPSHAEHRPTFGRFHRGGSGGSNGSGRG